MDNPRSTINIRTELAQTVFGSLPADVFDGVCERARIEVFEVASLLNSARSPLTYLRYVVRGHVEIIVRQTSGDEVSIADIGRGGWATWLACFLKTPPEQDFYSSASASYIALPVYFVQQICLQNPTLYPLIIEEIGVRERQLIEWTGQSVLVKPEQRMAMLIHLLARTQAIGLNSGTLNATQSRLASLARCSRQSANLLLKKLEEKQLIRIAYGCVEISDLAALEVFAKQNLLDSP